MKIERHKKDQTVLFEVSASDDFTRDQFPSGDYQHVGITFAAGAEVPEWLGGMKQLRSLMLVFEGDAVIPPAVFDLPALRFLDIEGDRLSSLPDALDNLPEIRRLDIHSNSLHVLPESIGRLGKLLELNIMGNGFKSLPEGIGDLTNLILLDIHTMGDSKAMLPESIGQLANLFRLDWTAAHDLPPPESASRLNIEQLCVKYHSWTEFPETFTQLSNLRHLYVGRTGMLERFPDSIVDMPRLESWRMKAPWALQELPENIGSMQELRDFSLTASEIPQLPDSFQDLQLGCCRISDCDNLEDQNYGDWKEYVNDDRLDIDPFA